MTTESPDLLVLPAVRAHLGDWVYYVSSMRMADIARRISFAEDIHDSSTLSAFIQRQITDRSAAIAAYITGQSQRFFNALVVAIYGGMPQWYDVELHVRQDAPTPPIPPRLDSAFGILTLDGSERLFAIDGQHRVAGIKLALQQSDNLGEEEVATIFVGHKNDPDGMERTRRLFTTLNRYAKPVSKYDVIAMDEDDIVAIVTRQLIDAHPLFQGNKISAVRTKNIPPSDTSSFTSIEALYDVNDIVMPSTRRGWSKFKSRRPTDAVIDEYYTTCTQFWDTMRDRFPDVAAYSEQPTGDARPYRNDEGGHILFRPAGLLIFAKAIRYFMDHGRGLAEAVATVARAPTNLGAEPWVGLLWSAGGRRMITAPENQRASLWLLVYALGGDLNPLRASPQRLASELQALKGRDTAVENLPNYR